MGTALCVQALSLDLDLPDHPTGQQDTLRMHECKVTHVLLYMYVHTHTKHTPVCPLVSRIFLVMMPHDR